MDTQAAVIESKHALCYSGPSIDGYTHFCEQPDAWSRFFTEDCRGLIEPQTHQVMYDNVKRFISI